MNLFKQSQDLGPSQTVQDELETQQTHKYCNQLNFFWLLLSCVMDLFTSCVGGGLCSYGLVTHFLLKFRDSLLASY